MPWLPPCVNREYHTEIYSSWLTIIAYIFFVYQVAPSKGENPNCNESGLLHNEMDQWSATVESREFRWHRIFTCASHRCVDTWYNIEEQRRCKRSPYSDGNRYGVVELHRRVYMVRAWQILTGRGAQPFVLLSLPKGMQIAPWGHFFLQKSILLRVV